MAISFVKLSKTNNFIRHISVMVMCTDLALMKPLVREAANGPRHRVSSLYNQRDFKIERFCGSSKAQSCCSTSVSPGKYHPSLSSPKFCSTDANMARPSPQSIIWIGLGSEAGPSCGSLLTVSSKALNWSGLWATVQRADFPARLEQSNPQESRYPEWSALDGAGPPEKKQASSPYLDCDHILRI